MKKKIWPSAVNGHLHAPPSKSAAQRAIAIAALAEGGSDISGPGRCNDVLAAMDVCRSLGAKVREHHNTLQITGGIRPPGHALQCGESGLGIRMFSGVAATLSDNITLTGTGSLLQRPMHAVESSLHALGVYCKTTNGYLPIHIRGPIRGGKAIIDGSQGSQVLTGILIGSPFAESDVYLEAVGLKSKPYIDMTLDIMQAFGVTVANRAHQSFFIRSGQRYKGSRFQVEGDWSGAAFLLVAGAIAGGVKVSNLRLSSPQADRKIMEALSLAGASIREGAGWVESRQQPLRAFDFDATHCPDLFPPLAVLAANCRGRSRITGAGRLHAKESDRAKTLKETFRRMGLDIGVEEDTMFITGGQAKAATVQSHGDHRIAMAAATAALKANGPVNIEGAEAVNKSYPTFFHDLQQITSP